MPQIVLRSHNSVFDGHAIAFRNAIRLMVEPFADGQRASAIEQHIQMTES
jgi:hypothetical protein